MIKIQGITIESPADPEGLAKLVDSMAAQHCIAERVAEKLFGLMVLLESVSEDDRGVIIERVRDLAYIHTEQGSEAIKALAETILDS